MDVAISHSHGNDQGVGIGMEHPLGVSFCEDDLFKLSLGSILFIIELLTIF